MNHTQTPWKVCPGETRTGETNVLVGSADNREYGLPIGNIHNKEDATFIAKCVNAHEELLAASKNALNVLVGLVTGALKEIGADSHAIAELRKAISKAEVI